LFDGFEVGFFEHGQRVGYDGWGRLGVGCWGR
jgi:hypothetical protein